MRERLRDGEAVGSGSTTSLLTCARAVTSDAGGTTVCLGQECTGGVLSGGVTSLEICISAICWGVTTPFNRPDVRGGALLE
jgi:hypothetical protein